MITEDYVSFDTAKLLNEKGFDWECFKYWHETDKELVHSLSMHPIQNISNPCFFGPAAPTLQMAMKWLREVHHWHIFVVPRWEDVEYMPGEWEEKMVGYQYVILSVGETNRKNEHPIITALTPESAYEAAITYCLKNLI